MIPVFDGHNDTLSAALRHPERDLATRQSEGHVDAVRAREGGLAGGFFAMFVAGDGSGGPGRPPPDPPAPAGPIDPDHALRRTLHMLALLRRLEARGVLRVCAGADDVEAAMAEGVLAAVPHVEGAEAVCDLEVLEVLHALSLRSLGLVWSRPNAYATGVPFAFPGSPDVGPGLTVPGRELVAACDRLRIVLDVSHQNEAGF